MNYKQMQINQKINKTSAFKINWAYSAETKSTSKFKTWIWIWTSEFSSRAKIFLNQGVAGDTSAHCDIDPMEISNTDLQEETATPRLSHPIFGWWHWESHQHKLCHILILLPHLKAANFSWSITKSPTSTRMIHLAPFCKE